MAVELIIDPWPPQQRRYRTETFCYRPKNCGYYQAGPKRVVPGRKGMRYVEEDWVDEEATHHRGRAEVRIARIRRLRMIISIGKSELPFTPPQLQG